MAGYLDILRPQVLTQVVKQVVASADPILSFMGFQPGGSNEAFFGHGREGLYHVYDDTRKVAKGRAPGTAAARSSKQPMKAVPFVYPRMHDSVSLLAEFFHNIGQISNPAQRDEAGKQMITRQTQSLMQKAANWRIAMTVGMLRDSLYVHPEGDDWFINYTSTSALHQIIFGTPAGNKDYLAAQAGIANAPYTSYRRESGTRPDGTAKHEYVATFNALQSIEWHISDEGLDLWDAATDAYTFQKHWPDTMVLFMGEPVKDRYTLYQGSEPIAEDDGGPGTG